MDKIKDRRSFDRLEIPGMKAVLVNNYWYQLFSYKLLYNILKILLKKTHLKNISVSGACILSRKNFHTGDSIYLIISLPGSAFIPVKGSVRWTSDKTEQNMYYAGIQFEAFRNGTKYNSYESLKQLHSHSNQKSETAH